MADASAPSPKSDMRRRILDAAALSLAEHGYEATTLRGLAAEAGLKAGSIYYHFASKDAIIIDVLNEGVTYVSRAIEEALAALPDETDGESRLAAALDAHLEALSAHRAYTRAAIRCYSMVPDTVRAATAPTRRAFDAQWLSILSRAQADGVIMAEHDRAVLHRIILGALNWSIEQRDAGMEARRALAGTLLAMLCNAGRVSG